jgi:ribonuclease HI
MTKRITVKCAALCEPTNPGGFGCWAFVVFDYAGEEIAYQSGCLGTGPSISNNLAAYQSVIEALRWANEFSAGAQVEVLTDSQLVANQVGGNWGCNSDHLRPLRDEVVRLVNILDADLRWIRGSENVIAKRYAWRTYDETRAAEGRRA